MTISSPVNITVKTDCQRQRTGDHIKQVQWQHRREEELEELLRAVFDPKDEERHNGDQRQSCCDAQAARWRLVAVFYVASQRQETNIVRADDQEEDREQKWRVLAAIFLAHDAFNRIHQEIDDDSQRYSADSTFLVSSAYPSSRDTRE